jgi:cyclopropane fatty-acyl-phospholipid synthase-like methyltransferase
MRGFLKGGKRVLELGCGAMKWVLACDPEASYFGMDVQVMERANWPRCARNRPGTTDVIQGDIRNTLGYSALRPDRIIIMDVIEHLPKAQGHDLLKGVAKMFPAVPLAVFTPDGFMPNGEYQELDSHPQKHLSGWTAEEFIQHGMNAEVWPDFHAPGRGAIYAWR